MKGNYTMTADLVEAPYDAPRASPFSDSAPTYREQGLSVMPCAPGTKFPGSYSAANGWRTAHDWQEYCTRLSTRFEWPIWDGWPDAGICLALGSASAPAGKILVAVDIDTDEPEELAAIKATLPGSPCAKRGAKGETQFYLANPCVINASFNDANKRRMLDLLAHGRQTVMPPTIHPNTGKPYVWLTPDTLEFFAVADLPELPDDIVERLDKALEKFGHVARPKLAAPGDADLQGQKVHRALNDAALANLDAWVPELGLYKCRKVGPGYKAVAVWRPSSSGRPLSVRAANLTIRSDGIKDWGEDKGYTPLDLVKNARGCDTDAAFRYLQERVAPAKPVILKTSNAEPAEERPPSCELDEQNINLTSRKGNLAFLQVVTSDGERVADPPSEESETETQTRPVGAGGLLRTVNYEPGLRHEPPTWLVKGLLPARGLGMLVGESQSGKSFLAIHAAVSVARGAPFFGKKVKPGAVLYIAAEGGSSVLPRIEAADEAVGGGLADNHITRAGKTPLARAPIKVTVETPNLSTGSGAVALARTLRAAHGEFANAGHRLSFVVLDTLHAAMCGGDEQSAADTGHALNPLREAAEELGIFVLIVHHFGKDLDRGARGSSALRAAVDTEIELRVPNFDGPKAKPAGVARRATLTKQRDGAVGDHFHYGLRIVELGRDEDGDAWTTCTVQECEAPKLGSEGLNKQDRDFLEAVRAAVAESGSERVAMKCARGRFYNARPDAKQGTKCKAWNRALEAAVEARRVLTDAHDEFIWFPANPANRDTDAPA